MREKSFFFMFLRYLEPQTGDMLTARFADFHFKKDEFPALGRRIKQISNDIMKKDIILSWILLHSDT